MGELPAAYEEMLKERGEHAMRKPRKSDDMKAREHIHTRVPVPVGCRRNGGPADVRAKYTGGTRG